MSSILWFTVTHLPTWAWLVLAAAVALEAAHVWSSKRPDVSWGRHLAHEVLAGYVRLRDIALTGVTVAVVLAGLAGVLWHTSRDAVVGAAGDVGAAVVSSAAPHVPDVAGTAASAAGKAKKAVENALGR